MIIDIKTEQEFQNIIDLNNGTIILKFGADWCIPCSAVNTLLNEVDEEGINATIIKVDVDNNPEIASEFRVMSIPTTFFLRNKAVSKVIRGTMSKQNLLDTIKEINDKNKKEDEQNGEQGV
jgi:thioredoxin 1